MVVCCSCMVDCATVVCAGLLFVIRMVVLCFDLCPSSVDLGLRGWCRML